MDYDIEVFKRDDSVSDNITLMNKISSEVFNQESFGDDECSENLNNDKDDITACLDKLFGEDWHTLMPKRRVYQSCGQVTKRLIFPPLSSCLAIYRCTHDIEMGFLSYISTEIEIISDD